MTRRDNHRGLPDELHTEGGLLSADFLERLGNARPSGKGDRSISGLAPSDYHLADRDTLSDAMTRAWNELRAHWQGFAARLEKDPQAATRAKDVAQHWLLPLFQTLGYGRLAAADKGATMVGDLDFPISHLWRKVPIHLVAWSQELDRPAASTANPSAANRQRRSPHGLLQDFLNKSDHHLWGFVSNGRSLRILRDHRSLTRSAYVELDLERMFSGDAFHAFRWLWLLLHESRVDADTPEQSRLEAWFKEASDEGVRALESLRGGVTRAIEVLANGFLRHSANTVLQDALGGANPALTLGEYYRELLRLAYRLIFVFVAEDRDALLDPAASDKARARYLRFYGTRRLRERALGARAAGRSGDRHDDLWESLSLVLGKLDRGYPELGLPALGGALFRPSATPHLNAVRLANEDLLEALQALTTTRDAKGLRFPVSWRLVGAEELGSIYESLLELHLARPTSDTGGGTALTLETAAGHARKTSGSYYTPSSLVECLLDTALDPVVAEAVRGKSPQEAESAILNLTVVDPAVGSGHFLLAAGRRLAKRLAQVRSGEDEPTLPEVRRAMRDVVGRCLYGVDLNEMAAELCKVGLWLEAIEPGRPLSFLDAHIQVGNSLLGATPELVAKGIPDAAWQELTGDDKDVVKALKRRNKQGVGGQLGLELEATLTPSMVDAAVVRAARGLDDMPDLGVGDIDAKEAAWNELVGSPEHQAKTLLADVWCAAFVWPKQVGDLNDAAPVAGMFARFAGNPHGFPETTKRVARELAERYRFFHWHLRFPAVMARGGFDVVLGNPPWERPSFEEIPFFQKHAPEIASSETSALRSVAIDLLRQTNAELYSLYRESMRDAEVDERGPALMQRYPFAGAGRANTYGFFAETARLLLKAEGRAGLVLPTGIATDAPYSGLWRSLCQSKQIVSLYDFENRAPLFPDVHRSYKFCLITFGGASCRVGSPPYLFYLTRAEQVRSSAPLHLTAQELEILNPSTLQPPIMRSLQDLELALKLQHGRPELRVIAKAWVGMTSESTSEDWLVAREVDQATIAETVPIYESKLMHQFDHRFGTYEWRSSTYVREVDASDKHDAAFQIKTQYRISSQIARAFLANKRGGVSNAVLAYRDFARATDARTLIATILPESSVIQPLNLISPLNATQALEVCAQLNAFVLDYLIRLRTPGMHVNVSIANRTPLLPRDVLDRPKGWTGASSVSEWIRPRVLELVYTAWDMQPFAKDLGYDGPPFKWDDTRRRHLRAELDAAFFHLYGLTRDEAAYILETFPIVRRDDESRFGTYLTKDLILAAYDQMTQSTAPPIEPIVMPRATTSGATPMPAKQTAKKTWRVMEYMAESGAIIGWGFLTSAEYAKWKKNPRSDRHMVRGYFVVATMESFAEDGQMPCGRLLDYFHFVGARPERGVSVDDMEATFVATDDHPARGDE